MAIFTNADIYDGDYGEWKYSKNGNKSFASYGKAIYLEDICEDLETGNVYLKLSCDYQGKEKRALIGRGELSDISTMRDLGSKGFSVNRKTFDTFVEVILLQEELFEKRNIPNVEIFSNLGWMEVPDGRGGFKLCYRLDKLIGNRNGTYFGNYDISPMGSYKIWKIMVKNDVVGHTVLELVLIAALAAVINGLISPITNGENPIIHLNYGSSSGKSTAAILAASTAGRPFDGTITRNDADGIAKTYYSVYQSWGATDNAMVATQAGNRGVVTILNELGKSLSRDMTRLIFDLSEGSDKKRLTPSLKTRISESFSTVFISTGESSLIDKCTAKLEGLSVRVMEISQPITDSAEHSNRIKEICKKNNGIAARKLAKFIINRGGANYVLPIYRKWQQSLSQTMEATTNKERFIEKFAALFMATAEIATEALQIDFDIEGLQQFLFDYDKQKGNDRNVALQAYEKVLEECRININNFHTPENVDNPPRGRVYGKICRCKNKSFNGKYVDEEFLIRSSYLEKILKKYGFPNKETCLRAWDEAKLLSKDKDRYTRSRQIDSNSPKEDVYVLMTFKPENPTTHKKTSIRTFISQKNDYKHCESLLEETEGGDCNGDNVANP